MQVFQVYLHFVHSSSSLKLIRHVDVSQQHGAHCIYTRSRRAFKSLTSCLNDSICPDWRSCQASKAKRPRVSTKASRFHTFRDASRMRRVRPGGNARPWLQSRFLAGRRVYYEAALGLLVWANLGIFTWISVIIKWNVCQYKYKQISEGKNVIMR